MNCLLVIGTSLLLLDAISCQDLQYDPFAHLNNNKLLKTKDLSNISINVDHLHNQLQTANLAKLFQNLNVKTEAACLTALLKLFAPVLAIKNWTPEAILSLLGKPVGKGLIFITVVYTENTFFNVFDRE